MKLQEWFVDTSYWTKGVMYADSSGKACDIETATCSCLLGGIILCYPNLDEGMNVFHRVRDYIGGSLTQWNDDPVRVFKDIHDLATELDI